MAIPTINFAGYVYNDAGDAVSGATVNLYAKNLTATSLANDTTDSNGRWDINYTTAGTAGLDIQIANEAGSSKRRLKYQDKIHLEEVDTALLNIRGVEGAAAAMYFYADEGEDAGDRWKFNAANAGVFTVLNDASGQGSYVAHVTITPNATVANSTFAVAGNLTVGNALTVTGTTTLNGNLVLGDAAADTLTIGATLQGASPLTFEGGTADGYETTFAITDPTADRTITFPNQGGYVPLFSASTATAVTTTVAELNLIDGGTARGTDAIGDGDGVLINDGGTMKMTTVETLATYLEGEMNAFSLATTFSSTVTVGADDTGYDVQFFGDTASRYWLWDTDADGVVQRGTLTVGVNDTGHDVKFFGATAGSYWLWDEDADGVVQIGTLTIGVDDAGHDVKFFGNAASAYMLWDTSADDLILAGAAGLIVPEGQFTLGSTAVGSTAGELNLLDGSAKSTASITIGDTDAFLVIDGTTTKQIPASDVKTYTAAAATALDDIAAGDAAANLYTTVGNITIDAQANDADVIIKVDDAGSAVTAVTFDGSAEGDALFVNNINVPGEVMTTKVSFTDGDDAMTVADGGGVTFAQDVTITDGKGIIIESEPADDAYTGIYGNFANATGSTITKGQIVYMTGTANQVAPARANAVGTMPAVAMAIADVANGATGNFLMYGFAHDASAFISLTIGGEAYVSDTAAGALDATAPADDGEFVQIVGIGMHGDKLFFNPQLPMVEIA